MSKATIITRLDSLLQPLGFIRRKSTWNRRVGSFRDVVDLQINKAGDGITVNAGVLDPDVHAILWNSAPPDFVDEAVSTVRARIGALIDGRERWWDVKDDGAANEIAAEVETRILSFFERLHSRQEIERWLEADRVSERLYPPPTLALAILKSLANKGSEACALLAQMQAEQSGTWRERIADVATRLRCPPD